MYHETTKNRVKHHATKNSIPTVEAPVGFFLTNFDFSISFQSYSNENQPIFSRRLCYMKDDKKKLSGTGFITETHNPPSLAGDSGIHLQLDEKGKYYHTPLEKVLRGLVSSPISGLGGVVRDISGPIDCGNEMRIGSDDMVLQIGGQTSPEAFGKDSYPKGFPPGVSEHCRHIVFGAGGSRLINAHREIVPKLKREK
jgi:hypothetical protein